MKNRKIQKILVVILIILSLLQPATAYAAGDVIYSNTKMLADNLEYSNAVLWDSDLGRTESYVLRMTGDGDVYPMVMNGETIYGGFTISQVVNYAQSLGKNVLAAVNTDFFAQSTVPIGIVIEDGIYKSSPEGRNALTLGYGGEASIVESPEVLITLLNNGREDDSLNAGNSVSLSHFNKMRSDTGGLILYSEVFSTVSTRTSTPGWFIRFKIIEGAPTVSGTMLLEVTEMLESESAIPIGEGYMILSAAEDSGLMEEFEKFAVGDTVTLTTTCNNAKLVSAKYATGGGDILISNGLATDPEGWTLSLIQRAPRTAIGIRADGTLVSYIADGRNSLYSIGLTLEELTEQMKLQGCIYAINMDGGGSTALSLRIPGENMASTINRPSDGTERRCATYLLYVTDIMPDGKTSNLGLINDGTIVLAESSVELAYMATDGGYMPALLPEDITVAAMDPGAVIAEDIYTAGSMAGTDRLSLYSPLTGAYGVGEIYVITRPTSITATKKDSAVPLSFIRLTPGERLELEIIATYYRRSVVAQAHSFTFEVSGDIGEMVEPGIFEAGDLMQQNGEITVSAGGRSIVIQVEVSGFIDMQDHWAKEYAEYLLREGISDGITKTEYGPSLLMKRGDFILMLYRAAGEPAVGDDENGFDDVPDDMYYSKALRWAKETGIAEGTAEESDGSLVFSPEDALTRQDAFTFTYRALDLLSIQYLDGNEEELARFPDADLIDDYALIPTATLIELGIVDGMDGILSPHTTLTRAQMAKVLSVVLQLR